MKRTGRISKSWSLIFVAVLLFAASGSVFSQDQTDEELKKKYGAIIGEYEFDLSELGGETALMTFYIENGELWADSGDGRPATLEPIEELEFAFEAEDPEQGRFEFYFLKDDEGKYSKCRVVLESMGLEIMGIKIGG
ncbi:MAG: hypothetical protein MUP98_17480 [Candidatus Aminicenantes bacterium]|nr:hypothetical protein [Candidatus Aminicenantes bacterium]